MFDRLKALWDNPKVRLSRGTDPEGSALDASAKRRAWVVIIADGRVGYIDHYKSDGKFGVRPVGFHSGKHYVNPSPHWSVEERANHPEELALSIQELRSASKDEIPAMWRST